MAQIRSKRGRVRERERPVAASGGGAMAGIGLTSPEFINMATPSIIGPNKSMGRERGVRRTRSGDRKRPRTSGGGAELNLAAQVIGVAPTSVFTQEEGRERAREVPVYSLPTCEAQRSAQSDGEAAERQSEPDGGRARVSSDGAVGSGRNCYARVWG